MEFIGVVREMKGRMDARGINIYVEIKLETIWGGETYFEGEINLDEAKSLLGKAVCVRIERLGLKKEI